MRRMSNTIIRMQQLHKILENKTIIKKEEKNSFDELDPFELVIEDSVGFKMSKNKLGSFVEP